MIDFQSMTWGFDVSHYQRDFDFQAAADAGASFCFIRASTGNSMERDREFVRYVEAASKAGLDVGAYHYLVPGSAEEQAGMFYSAVNSANVLRLTLPLVIDAEDRKLSMGGVYYFMERMRYLYDAKYMIYTGPSAWKSIRQNTEKKTGYPYVPLWIAHWNVESPELPVNWSEIGCDYWQCGQVQMQHYGFGRGTIDINVKMS